MANCAAFDFSIKEGAELPALEVDVKYRDATGALVEYNLNGYTDPRFRMRPVDDETNVVDEEPATLTAATSGNVCRFRYAWGAGDTADPGEYRGEFLATSPDGSDVIFPTAGFIAIRVTGSLEA